MSEQERRIFLSSGDLLSISEASRFTPYSAEYLSLRARGGKLKAVKIGRNWLTTKNAVLEYLQIQQEKHERQSRILAMAQLQAGSQFSTVNYSANINDEQADESTVAKAMADRSAHYISKQAGFIKLKSLLFGFVSVVIALECFSIAKFINFNTRPFVSAKKVVSNISQTFSDFELQNSSLEPFRVHPRNPFHRLYRIVKGSLIRMHSFGMEQDRVS